MCLRLAANDNAFVKYAHDRRLDRGHDVRARLGLWKQRWLERRRFARELPWMADEVLVDYGLTREQARQLCRRPFWRV